MSFVSTAFVLFFFGVALVFYLIPQKYKWIVLLITSYLFYASSNIKALLFIASSTVVSYFIARRITFLTNKAKTETKNITNKDEKRLFKAQVKTKKKLYVAAGLIFCFGILAILKYTNFCIKNINLLISFFGGGEFNTVNFILPLGLSFYTFQIASYIFDVYYGKYDAENNFFHYALFVSYFPSILQGPISRYNDMKIQFFETQHSFNLKNFQFALQRILWGYLKKLVIADRAKIIVDYVFENHTNLPFYITFMGLVFYSIELYADFSGGMDVVIGVSDIFGIKLKENFRQPFFSKSISDFWRRWHITLGTWMRDYIFYPFSLSKTANNLAKLISNKNKFLGKVIPVCIGNILVFLVVGVWHGAE